jgi:hypothetical protein
MRTQDIFNWIRERHNIYLKRQQGKPKPWTEDEILQSYRFCNVYRELDTVTQWIARYWRNPHAKDPHLWFAMVVARLLNWPATLQVLGYPAPWTGRMYNRFTGLRCLTIGKVFSGAYIVSTNGHKMDKLQYLAERVLDPLWDARKNLTGVLNMKSGHCSLAAFHNELMQFDGLGSFMAAQVIADLKYTAPLSSAPDWCTWAASGPGSRRGLNRVLGRPVDTPWREAAWLGQLHTLHLEIEPMLRKEKMPRLHAQDLQNCLCEFDKYERTRLGEGRPRSTYPGGGL